MIYISELLPNPAGKDTDGEWIEVCTAGNGVESLMGWKLQNTKGKTFSLPDRTLAPYECIAFDYATTKLTLTNTGGTFYLLNPAGEITDSAIYEGTYKDDVSAMRTTQTSVFVMSTTPTKGLQNKLTAPVLKAKKSPEINYMASVGNVSEQKTEKIPQGVGSLSDVIVAGSILAGMLTAVFWYIFKKLYIQKKTGDE